MTVVELFSGAGGASLGLVAAGFTEVRAVEWNHDACETRRAAGLRCDEGDVRDPAHYAGVEADAVWSSFPCQAWSTAGKRLGKDDPRNGWPWTVDVLDQVKPAWFMAENVPGLTHHRGGCNGRCVDDCARLYFEQTILADLRARFASVQWSILDAARFGVPQNRERLIIVAGPRPIEWPRETHAPPEELVGLFETRRPWVTVRQALGLTTGGDAPAPTLRAANKVSGSGAKRAWERLGVSPGALHALVAELEDDSGLTDAEVDAELQAAGVDLEAATAKLDAFLTGRGDIPQSRRPMRLDAPADTIQASGEGPRPPCIPTRAASRPELLDKPSPTVTAVGECKGSGDGGNPEKMQRASDALWLGAGIRRLTPAECATLQAFPPDHPWRGTKTSIYAQIGNSVPAPLARVVAEAVKAADPTALRKSR